MSTSMYEVFNWGYANDDSGPANANAAAAWSSTPFRTGKRMQFSIAGPQINIDDPLPATEPNYRSDHCSSSGGGHGMSSARKGRHHRETLLLGGGGFGSAAPASNGERTQRAHLHISPAVLLSSSSTTSSRVVPCCPLFTSILLCLIVCVALLHTSCSLF